MRYSRVILVCAVLLAVSAAAYAADEPVLSQAEQASLQAARLRDKSVAARLDAVNKLAALPDGGADELLAGHLRREKDAYLRVRTVEALAALRSTASLAGLLYALGDPNPSVRQAAAIELPFFEDEKAVLPALEKTLAGEKDRRVRAAAVRALGFYRGDRAADAAGSVLSGGDDEGIKLQAVDSLERMGTARAAEKLAKADGGGDLAVGKAAAGARDRLEKKKLKKGKK